MLANLLAVIVGTGSLAFYLAAFVLPEVHRRSDFFWSGIGMFYAVVLWYCARQMNGAVLLGQTASVGLLLWLGYQTLLLRRETTPAAQQTPIRLGKADRNRLNGSANRPITNDYEFVEDGVEDAIDQDPDPNSPVLIKSAADKFAPKLVVPAAIPKPVNDPEESSDVASPTPQTSTTPKVTIKRQNPVAAIGIFAGWLKEVVTPKKKAAKPIIELPPRPPSIQKSDISLKTADSKETLTQPPNTDKQSKETLEILETSFDNKISASPAATETIAKTPKTPPSDPVQPSETDEDSNWPDDDFWD